MQCVLFYNPIKQCVSMQGRQQQWWCTGDRTFMVVLACIVSYSTLFYTQQHPNGYCVNISILSSSTLLFEIKYVVDKIIHVKNLKEG